MKYEQKDCVHEFVIAHEIVEETEDSIVVIPDKLYLEEAQVKAKEIEFPKGPAIVSPLWLPVEEAKEKAKEVDWERVEEMAKKSGRVIGETLVKVVKIGAIVIGILFIGGVFLLAAALGGSAPAVAPAPVTVNSGPRLGFDIPGLRCFFGGDPVLLAVMKEQDEYVWYELHRWYE